eukprot:snap_masked-scaffold_98-processed-gene-0.19-mRNA-1 protein AED:1.00 eAED:1.00 QI:0/-1/0/0/-1/1/1/0/331
MQRWKMNSRPKNYVDFEHLNIKIVVPNIKNRQPHIRIIIKSKSNINEQEENYFSLIKKINSCSIYFEPIFPLNKKDVNYIASLISHLEVSWFRIEGNAVVSNADFESSLVPIIFSPKKISSISIIKDYFQLSADLFFISLSQIKGLEKITYQKFKKESHMFSLVKFVRVNGDNLTLIRTIVNDLFPPLLKFKSRCNIFPKLNHVFLEAEKDRENYLLSFFYYLSKTKVLRSLDTFFLYIDGPCSLAETQLIVKVLHSLDKEIKFGVTVPIKINSSISLLFNSFLWSANFLKKDSNLIIKTDKQESFHKKADILVEVSENKFFKKVDRVKVA